MNEGVGSFFNSIVDAANLEHRDLVDLFVYYLTVEKGDDAVTARSIDQC